MPIFSFGLIVKDTFLSTRGRFSRYRISAFSKTTSPSCGQSRGGVLFLIRAGASRESVFKTKPQVQFPVNKTLERKIISCSFQQEFFPADSPISVYGSFMMSCVAGYEPSGSEVCCVTLTTLLFPSCCLNNDIGPSTQQCFSSMEFKIYFRPIHEHNSVEFYGTPKTGCFWMQNMMYFYVLFAMPCQGHLCWF